MAKYMDVEQMLQDLKECNVDSVEVGLAVMQLTEYLRHAPGADVVPREQYESLVLAIAEANRKYAEDSLGVLQQIYKNVSAADVVEVVRCKDCYWADDLPVCHNPERTKSWYGCRVPPDHFCSYGKRKDGLVKKKKDGVKSSVLKMAAKLEPIFFWFSDTDDMGVKDAEKRKKCLIKKHPTKFAESAVVEYAPVVRCRNCIYRHSSEFCECRPENAFCSDGEWRTEIDGPAGAQAAATGVSGKSDADI